MKKAATVYTNDRTNPTLRLTVSGPVERFAAITPGRVVLNGYADTKISRSVEIRQEKKYPFKITEAKARRGEHIRFELSEMAGKPQTGYILSVENLKNTGGRYYDQVVLKTDSTIKPEIRIGVSGYIKERSPDAAGQRAKEN
jgi:hypothetical protein